MISEYFKREYWKIPANVFWPGLLLAVFFVYHAFVPQIWGSENTDFMITRGESLRVVAANLKEQGHIRSKTFFEIYGLVLGRDRSLKAGRYDLSSRTAHGILMEISGNGGSDDIRVTIPEGFNVWEIDKRLASVGLTLPGEILNFRSREGWLFPDTYNFSRGDTPLTIIQIMSDNFSAKTEELRRKAAQEGKNWNDVVIMASIIEKEARNTNDMRLVADVLWKRLEAGMELKVDAAVAYGACLLKGKDCDASKIGIRQYLDMNSRYNTYRNMGLPPGPISNPGLKSLEAALDPKSSSYWYYLSTGSGTILFSKTGSEHELKRDEHILGN